MRRLRTACLPPKASDNFFETLAPRRVGVERCRRHLRRQSRQRSDAPIHFFRKYPQCSNNNTSNNTNIHMKDTDNASSISNNEENNEENTNDSSNDDGAKTIFIKACIATTITTTSVHTFAHMEIVDLCHKTTSIHRVPR